MFLFWLAWLIHFLSSFLLSVVLKCCRAWLRRNETDLGVLGLFHDMVVCLCSNKFGQNGCQHLALRVTCLCERNAAFLGKEEWENQLLSRTTKPASSMMRSSCLRVMWFLGKVLATDYFSAYAEMVFGWKHIHYFMMPKLTKSLSETPLVWRVLWYLGLSPCVFLLTERPYISCTQTVLLPQRHSEFVHSSSEGHSHSGWGGSPENRCLDYSMPLKCLWVEGRMEKRRRKWLSLLPWQELGWHKDAEEDWLVSRMH